jgi:hypothetical protein
VEGVAGFGGGAVEEDFEGFSPAWAGDAAVEEARAGEGFAGGGRSARRRRMSTSCVFADGGFIHAGDPRGDGVASDDGVGDARRIECGGGAEQAVTDFFHGANHAVQGDFGEDGGHGLVLLPPGGLRKRRDGGPTGQSLEATFSRA